MASFTVEVEEGCLTIQIGEGENLKSRRVYRLSALAGGSCKILEIRENNIEWKFALFLVNGETKLFSVKSPVPDNEDDDKFRYLKSEWDKIENALKAIKKKPKHDIRLNQLK